MAERFSEDSDGGNLLEGMSLTDSQADDPSEHWWKEHQECLQPWNCDGNTSTCLNGCGVTTSQSLAGRVGKKLEEHYTWGPINVTVIQMTIYSKGQTEQDNPFSLASSECSSPSSLHYFFKWQKNLSLSNFKSAFEQLTGEVQIQAIRS